MTACMPGWLLDEYIYIYIYIYICIFLMYIIGCIELGSI